ncbi:MAG TPA: hypothetical protein VFS21_23620 [Roseiflexaceae bacterium]|nr:hypothetical protein [Roseiflexaceae bacterium]
MSGAARARNNRWSAEQVALRAGDVGVWLAAIAFGVPLFVINGGFSVAGLGWFCRSFNTAGQLIWAALEAFAVGVPVVVPGLPTTLPVLPWSGVVAGSLCQIAVAWLKINGREVPTKLMVATVVLSAYDFATTLFGLFEVGWLARFGLLLQIPVAGAMTFSLELIIGAVLPRQPRRGPRWRSTTSDYNDYEE